jgi:MFS family permease
MMRSDLDLGTPTALLSQLDHGLDGGLHTGAAGRYGRLPVGQEYYQTSVDREWSEPSQPSVDSTYPSPHTHTPHTNGRKALSGELRQDQPDVAPDLGELYHSDQNGAGQNGQQGGRNGNTADASAPEVETRSGVAILESDGDGTQRRSLLPPDFNGDDEPEPGFLPVLKNRNFLVLWAGQVFSQLADKVYLVLMIMIITSRFQSAGQTISGWVSAIMIAFTIPAVLFGSVAGVYVDHWSKKGVLVFTNLLRGGLVLALPFLLWISQGWSPFAGIPIGFGVLLSITFLVSTLTQFFAPAEQAAIPLIVERRHLLSANSLYTTTMMASVIIGFAVGEPLLAIADSLIGNISNSLDIGKELLVGVSYAIAGVLLMLLHSREKEDQPDQPHPQVWENIRDGLRYLSQQSRVRVAMMQLVILFSIFAALAVLAVRLAEIMPALKSSQFGFLLAAGGVGMALGAVLIGHYGQRVPRVRLSLYGSIGMAITLTALSFFPERLVPTLLLLTALGGFAAMVGIPMQTAIQEETPEEMRGKVFGLQNNAINIALSLPLALAGVAETYFGLGAVFVGLAVLALLGGVITWSVARPE